MPCLSLTLPAILLGVSRPPSARISYNAWHFIEMFPSQHEPVAQEYRHEALHFFHLLPVSFQHRFSSRCVHQRFEYFFHLFCDSYNAKLQPHQSYNLDPPFDPQIQLLPLLDIECVIKVTVYYTDIHNSLDVSDLLLNIKYGFEESLSKKVTEPLHHFFFPSIKYFQLASQGLYNGLSAQGVALTTQATQQQEPGDLEFRVENGYNRSLSTWNSCDTKKKNCAGSMSSEVPYVFVYSFGDANDAAEEGQKQINCLYAGHGGHWWLPDSSYSGANDPTPWKTEFRQPFDCSRPNITHHNCTVDTSQPTKLDDNSNNITVTLKNDADKRVGGKSVTLGKAKNKTPDWTWIPSELSYQFGIWMNTGRNLEFTYGGSGGNLKYKDNADNTKTTTCKFDCLHLENGGRTPWLDP